MRTLGEEPANSMDRAAGIRCRTTRLIRTHAGNVPPAAAGTIVSEIHNLGRHMLEVRWDGGVCAYVFPDEIEIVGVNH